MHFQTHTQSKVKKNPFIQGKRLNNQSPKLFCILVSCLPIIMLLYECLRKIIACLVLLSFSGNKLKNKYIKKEKTLPKMHHIMFC